MSIYIKTFGFDPNSTEWNFLERKVVLPELHLLFCHVEFMVITVFKWILEDRN